MCTANLRFADGLEIFDVAQKYDIARFAISRSANESGWRALLANSMIFEFF